MHNGISRELPITKLNLLTFTKVSGCTNVRQCAPYKIILTHQKAPCRTHSASGCIMVCIWSCIDASIRRVWSGVVFRRVCLKTTPDHTKPHLHYKCILAHPGAPWRTRTHPGAPWHTPVPSQSLWLLLEAGFVQVWLVDTSNHT